MPLSAGTPRHALHHRNISVRGYKRDDGNYDIEGHLQDAKDVVFDVGGRTRAVGEPVHSMWLRITINRELTILDAEAAMDAMPYVGQCNQIAPSYKKLVGLVIRPGFSQRVMELFGSQRGCTHVTDLISSIATTAFQSLSGQGIADLDKRPFQLNKCHALVLDGPVAARYYPRWYTGAEADPSTDPLNR